MGYEFSKYTTMTEEEIIAKLKANLKPSRFEHSLRVAATAEKLAIAYGCDVTKARLAGLLHDNAKYPTDEEITEACRTHNYVLSESEQHSFSLIHGGLGAVTVQSDYDISDIEIIDAIRYHTTGRPAMTLLEKIIYVADFIEPGRDFPNEPSLDDLRELAPNDLDMVVMFELKNVVEYIRSKGWYLGSISRDAELYYIDLIENRKKESKFMSSNSKEMLKIAYKAAEDKKAIDVKAIDISKVSILAEYFLIASGNSAPQVEAIVDNIEKELFTAGYDMPRVEGNKNSGWILLDYNDIVVHVFAKEDREFYDLERLWRDGSVVDAAELTAE